MTTLNEEKTEKMISELLEKFLKKTSEDMLDQFYGVAKTYLYEHYKNFNQEIYDEMCEMIMGNSREFFRDVYQKHDRLIDCIYRDNEDEILKRITIQKMYGEFSEIMKNKTYHWSNEGTIKNCTIKYIKENLGELNEISDLVSAEIVKENKALKKDIEYAEQRCKDLCEKLDGISFSF